jgi:Ca2+-transporting ATPase
MSGTTWHAKGEKEALRLLGVTPNGLNDQEVRRRLEKYGPNELKETQRVTALDIFLNQFKDIFVIMLLISTAIAYYVDFAKGETPINAITIAVIVLLNAFVGFIQEYRSERAIEAMRKMTTPKAMVIRDGVETSIQAKEVVPGDILRLEAGDRIAADARLIEVVELRTDESVLTGESTPVEKALGILDENIAVGDRSNMALMATYVTYGRGKALVTSTGMSTEFGKVAGLVGSIEQEETPLKLKLEGFAKRLGTFVIIAAILVFLLEAINPARPGSLLENLLTAVALAVSAVPEGLPAVVTVTLALGARELAKRNAIIRGLSSVETLGATTIICSDKTGTLTKGEMTVRSIYVDDENIEVTGVGYDAKGDFLLNANRIDPKDRPDLSFLLTGFALCTNASYDGKGFIGDVTEGALIVAAQKAGLVKDELESQYNRVYEIPFTSERKYMITLHRDPQGKILAFIKGAPEVVLGKCARLLKDGQIASLTDEGRQPILKANEEMANEAMRLLAVAFKEIPDQNNGSFANALGEWIEDGFVFVGMVGMIDPPRQEAKIANERCRKAGITTVMITGDHKLTAIAVAKEIGMMREGDLALTGAELDKMSDMEFERVVEDVAVYARTSPEHKLRIVRALKKKKHIVAMTGDGVNDAPALKQADIGIAMGITGTDVTKEAADMVLADDNFATIVRAVEDGRTIYDNIRKFAFFLIRCNFDELLIVGTFALLGLELPLTAGMILWLNLMTDGAPAIALSQDPPVEDIMSRAPRNPQEGILHGRMASILGSFVTQFLGTAGLFYLAYYVWGEPLEEARSLAFMQATLQELIVIWNCRSETKNAFRVGFTSNKYLLLAVLFSATVTAIIPYTGMLFGVQLFETAPLTLQDWAIVIPVSLSGFLLMPEIFYNRRILRWS